MNIRFRSNAIGVMQIKLIREQGPWAIKGARVKMGPDQGPPYIIQLPSPLSSIYHILRSNLQRLTDKPMEQSQDSAKIKAFLTRGGGETYQDKLQAHILYGWKWNTVLLYNGAVKKFLKFKKETSGSTFELPASVEEIYEFCMWAGRTNEGPTAEDVLSGTVSKYLHGLKAWHLYHLEKFPAVEEGVIKQILTASKRLDVSIPKKEGKKPIHLKHLVHLAVELSSMGEKELAVLDTVLVAFWGLARLGEMVSDKKERSEVITWGDVHISVGSRREARITIRGAKTSKAGEKQTLQGRELNHLLCPVAALERRIARVKDKDDPLFAYKEEEGEKRLSKQVVMSTCQKSWKESFGKGITGHSFRVGGASFRYAIGVKIENICIIGRWKSEAYRLYIKAYSKKELSDTLKLMNELENNKLH